MRKNYQKVKITHFKRWSRKKYAVFNSLHKLVVISAIAMGCSFIGKPTKGAAQSQPDSSSHVLKEILVSAEESPDTQQLESTLLQVSLTKQEIERVPVQDLNDLLNQLQGIDIRRRGPLGVQADISYRGGNFDQTMVLLNGINFTDPQTGHYTLNLPVTPGIINKIELYNNTTAFLYGTSPFSGLINIITRPDTVNSVAMELTGGMYGLLNTSAALNISTGPFSHLLSVNYTQSDGYIHNTDFNITNAYYQTIGHFKRGELQFQAGYSGKQYGANGFYSLRFPDQYESLHTFLTSVKWIHKGKVEWSPSVYYRNNMDCFELVKAQDPKKNNYHRTQIGGANFFLAFRTIAGKTSLSADIRLEDIVSTSLGYELGEPISSYKDSIFYTHRRTRGNIGISASQYYTRKGWEAELTLLIQHFTDIKKKIYFLPAGYVSYRFKPRSIGRHFITEKIYLSGSGTMRMPTFTDLYYKTGDIQGNPDLLPEKAYTVEMGFNVKWRKQRALPAYLNANIALFNRWGIHMIDYIKSDTDYLWRTVNHTDIRFLGAEIMLEYFPRNHVNSDFFISHVILQYSYLNSNKESKGYQSRYTLDHLIHRLTLRFGHRIIKGLEMDYALSYNKRKGEYTSYKQNPEGRLATFPDYWLLDIRIQYTYKILNFYLDISNVLNQKYFDLGDLEQPGIWVRGGIRCKMNI